MTNNYYIYILGCLLFVACGEVLQKSSNDLSADSAVSTGDGVIFEGESNMVCKKARNCSEVTSVKDPFVESECPGPILMPQEGTIPLVNIEDLPFDEIDRINVQSTGEVTVYSSCQSQVAKLSNHYVMDSPRYFETEAWAKLSLKGMFDWDVIPAFRSLLAIKGVYWRGDIYTSKTLEDRQITGFCFEGNGAYFKTREYLVLAQDELGQNYAQNIFLERGFIQGADVNGNTEQVIHVADDVVVMGAKLYFNASFAEQIQFTTGDLSVSINTTTGTGSMNNNGNHVDFVRCYVDKDL